MASVFGGATDRPSDGETDDQAEEGGESCIAEGAEKNRQVDCSPLAGFWVDENALIIFTGEGVDDLAEVIALAAGNHGENQSGSDHEDQQPKNHRGEE